MKGMWFGPDDPPGAPPLGAAPPSGTPPSAAPPPGGEPGPIPYARFKEVNDQLQDLRHKEAQREAAEKAANDKRLADEKKWEELAATRDAELKTERLQRLRLEVALKKGLPPELAARLTGETPEQLEKDAEALLPLLKPRSPGVPPGGGDGQPAKTFDLSKMTPEEIRKSRGELFQAAGEGRLKQA